MNIYICHLLLFIGLIFMVLAAIGILKMPDFYMRLSITTKATTLGVGLILIAAAFYFNNLNTTTRIIAILFFIFLTAPVAAHIIGKSSYLSGVKMWENSIIDEFKSDLKKKALRQKEKGTEKTEETQE